MHDLKIHSMIGWDVGGAHLKTARLSKDGTLQQVIQVPCALWRGLHELEAAIDQVLQLLGEGANAQNILHAVTMTGELVDLFEHRRAGVVAISNTMATKLEGRACFYTGAQQQDFSGWATVGEVEANWHYIASANWLATAADAGQRLKTQNIHNAILVDIGSTTSDFIVLKHGQPQCTGFTDAARMQSDELVYTGVVRTPLMAVAQKIHFQNQLTSTAAEYFAATADVYRLTGELDPADDMADTADGKEKTLLASARRLARMIGRDVEDAQHDDWLALARAFRAAQLARLEAALRVHLQAFSTNEAVTLIGAGVGQFLVQALAEKLHKPYQTTSELYGVHDKTTPQHLNHWASACLPAVAVAHLAYRHFNHNA